MSAPEKKKKRKKVAATVAAHQYSELDKAVLAFGDAWLRLQTATADKGLTQTTAIELMEKLGLKNHATETASASGSISVTLVKGERVKIDWDRFKKKVGAAVWKKITKDVPDQGLIDQAIVDGLFTLEDLAECSSTVPNSPYLRPTIKGNL